VQQMLQNLHGVHRPVLAARHPATATCCLTHCVGYMSTVAVASEQNPLFTELASCTSHCFRTSRGKCRLHIWCVAILASIVLCLGIVGCYCQCRLAMSLRKAFRAGKESRMVMGSPAGATRQNFG
jgi:hypothetical protein